MQTHRIRKFAALGAAALMLAACAGTAPNAVQKGFPKARLHAGDKPDCRDVDEGEACRDKRFDPIDCPGSGLADQGFHAAKTWEAREAIRERKRNK